MRKEISSWLLISIILIIVTPFAWRFYQLYDSYPQGPFTSWGKFYSPSEKIWVEYEKHENGYFRDLNGTGNPFDRRLATNFIRMSDKLIKELEEDNKTTEYWCPEEEKDN